jgi:hypothetical protein
MLHLRGRVGAPEVIALDLVMFDMFNSTSCCAVQWVKSAMLACAAVHCQCIRGQGDSAFLLAYLHAPLQCCFNLHCWLAAERRSWPGQLSEE